MAPDLTTTYLGLHLKNPLVASASPLSKKIDTVHRLEDAGAAAIVMYSLFEEQITHESYELDYHLERGTHSFAESLSYFPELEYTTLLQYPKTDRRKSENLVPPPTPSDLEKFTRMMPNMSSGFALGPGPYLEHLHRVKQAVDIPVIGSLNGVSSGGWLEYAHKIEQAGADALESNIYYLPTDIHLSASALEDTYVQLVRDVRAKVKLPLAIKLSPFFTSLPHIANRFAEAGADGLVLFNRFYQPDFDLEEMEVVPNLELSTSQELRLPLRWIAILYGRIATDFALTSGVHTAQDVLKAMMAGASVAMMASTLLHNGVGRIMHILNDLQEWMETHEYESIKQMRGSMSQRAVADPSAYERANYMKALNNFNQYIR